MRLGTVAENPVEWLVARLNVVPRPLFETQMAYTLARLVMVGTKLGVFDALAEGPATAAELARRCGTNPTGTEKLLFALAGADYLRARDGRYELTPVSRKWLLRDSPNSISDKLLLQFLEWDWMERSEDYVRTGEPLELHSMTDEGQWDLYQRGMRAMANAFSGEAVKRMPLSKDPKNTDDLGADAYDIVLIAQVVHHFSEEQNRELAKRVARALRPGGVYAVLDAFRPRTASDAGQVGALLEFFFALTSQSGTWAVEEMSAWQREAGLSPRKPIRFRTAPGVGIQAAYKPA